MVLPVYEVSDGGAGLPEHGHVGEVIVEEAGMAVLRAEGGGQFQTQAGIVAHLFYDLGEGCARGIFIGLEGGEIARKRLRRAGEFSRRGLLRDGVSGEPAG